MKKQLLLIFCIALNPLSHAMEQPKDLIQAAQEGDLARVQELIQAGVDLDQTDDRGETALIRVAYIKHLPADRLPFAQELIQDGARLPIVQELIRAGADVYKQANDKRTVLNAAAIYNHRDIAKILLTGISDADAEKIRNLFFTLYWTAKKSTPLLGSSRFFKSALVLPIITDVVEERLRQAYRLISIQDSWRESAHTGALRVGHSEMAALLDKNNQESQDELRQIITENIYEILKNSPQEALE